MTMPRCSVKVTIRNKLGLHARPAMSFVDAASAFASAVTVKRTDGKSDCTHYELELSNGIW